MTSGSQAGTSTWRRRGAPTGSAYTEDHTLDIWVEADGSWRWKDEDELQTAVLLGYFTVGEAAAFRAEGERVVAEWPFPTGWEEWRPEPSLEVPAVPAGWDAIVAETPPG